MVSATEKHAGWDDYSAAASHDSDHWAASDRGWFRDGTEGTYDTDFGPMHLRFGGPRVTVGNYLDYGPNHYRALHTYCRPGRCHCAESQPGSVHAVVTRLFGLPFQRSEARYFRTVEEAKQWIEEASGYRIG